ncbi:heavy-metal-associated domain-containing protein [Leptospira gomenensis]|uniref:heavy-metal-associated domain-containing protein n=1 Tax=Leptospira gomenensis TaxID=2484974 RepID=UPI001AEF3AAC|nr:heavy-metal-associated domain-containing protein [Leptospira gomenensis]
MFEFKVENMTCPSCAGVVTKSIKSVDPTVPGNAKVSDQSVFVQSELSDKESADLIEECGFPVRNIRSDFGSRIESVKEGKGGLS